MAPFALTVLASIFVIAVTSGSEELCFRAATNGLNKVVN